MSSRFNVKSNLTRRSLVAGAGLWLAAPAIVRAAGQNGVALVIGNAKYLWESPLPNVKRDVTDVAKRLQEIGLKTELVQDASRATMRAAVEKFKSAAAGADFALFYYAGHGASWDRNAYIVPVDIDLSTPDAVKNLQNVTEISDAIKDAAHKLLIFDSCRNNPADGWRQRDAAASSFISATERTASQLRGVNTLVVFSTAPGRIALDGTAGANSPFAAAFIRQTEEDIIDITELPAKIRRDVLLATGGRQIIWDENTYSRSFMIKRLQKGKPLSSSALINGHRMVELPKAYAFAEKKFPLPKGLVGIRSPGADGHDQKIGSFATEVKMRVGNHFNSYWDTPLLVLVLSIDEAGAAQTIMASQLYGHLADGSSKAGNAWVLFTGKLVGQKVEYSPYGPVVHAELRWKDRDNGTFETLRPTPYSGLGANRFMRLDG